MNIERRIVKLERETYRGRPLDGFIPERLLAALYYFESGRHLDLTDQYHINLIESIRMNSAPKEA